MSPLDGPTLQTIETSQGILRLVVDERLSSQRNCLLPLLVDASLGAIVTVAPLDKCLVHLNEGTADAAIVRLPGLEANEIGRLRALPLVTPPRGTMILFENDALARGIAKLARLSKAKPAA